MQEKQGEWRVEFVRAVLRLYNRQALERLFESRQNESADKS